MDASVVIPVYNGEKTIGKTLEAILKQTYQGDFEVIVADDGSTDKSKEIIRGYPVKYIYQRNAGPAAARNTGWKQAQGDIVVFTDSDCIPVQDWLSSIIHPFKDQKVAGVGGRYLTANKDSGLARFIGMEIDFRHRRFNTMNREIDAIGAYSAAFRSSVLREVGGFDEMFSMAAGEDWDLSYRVIKAGYKLVYQPKAEVAHYHTASLLRYLGEQYTHGKWRVYAYFKHPEMALGDEYTGRLVKYQVAAAGLLVLSLPLILPWFRFSFLVPLFPATLLLLATLPLFAYQLRQEKKVAFLGIGIQFIRNFVWLLGGLAGVIVALKSKRTGLPKSRS